jgi:glutamate dehydrogenase (NAD(P)+)/glutamate dehydrogenase (NADP+)
MDSPVNRIPKKLTLESCSPKDDTARFPADNDGTAEQLIRVVDPATGSLWGFVVVDDTQRGPGLGGIRMASDVTLGEVRRLARAMTLKNSAANLPFGGGKAGIVCDPVEMAHNPGMKRDLIGLFAEVLFSVENYIPAPDMGTDETDIQQIYEYFSERLGTPHHMRGGASRPHDKGGIPIDEWGLTAHSLFAAIRTVEELESEFQLKGAQVVIQGYGNVGSVTASKLSDVGAVITGASDIHGALWHPNGLNVEQLNSVRRQPGGISNYSGKVEKRFDPDQIDWLLEAPCDILIPAARPDAITARNADRIQCRKIFQGANAPSNKMTEYYLHNRRGIVSYSDFIVNVGGVMGCAVELKMTMDGSYREQVLSQGEDGKTYVDRLIFNTVSNNIRTLMGRLRNPKGSDRIFREEAQTLAQERLDHPDDIWL